MRVSELIATLQQLDPKAEVKVWDNCWHDIELLVVEPRAKGKTVTIYIKPEEK